LSVLVGTGTVHESGAAGLAATLVVIYLGSAVAWSALAYVLMSLRTAQQAVPADHSPEMSTVPWEVHIVKVLLLASAMSVLAGVLSWGYYSEGFVRYAAAVVGAPFIAAGRVASDALAVALGFAMYVLFFLIV
jgi:hypothetical protein